VHLQAVSSSSLLGAPPWLTGPRGISHVQSEPVFGQPRTQPYQPQWSWNQPQQPQVPVQHWQSQQRLAQRWPGAAQPQQLSHPLLRTTNGFRPSNWRDVSTFSQSGNTNTVMKGSRGGRSGQHVTARPPAPIMGPRSVEKTLEIRSQLLGVFPNDAQKVDFVLRQNDRIYSVDELCLIVSELV